jgi:lysyl-tRNA synthetase class II
VTGSPQIKVTPLPSLQHTNNKEIIIDFNKPFKRISIIDELENVLNTKLPDINDPGISFHFIFG